MIEIQSRLNPARTLTVPWGPKFIYLKREVGEWEPATDEDVRMLWEREQERGSSANE